MNITHDFYIVWSWLLLGAAAFIVFLLVHNFRRVTTPKTGWRGFLDRCVQAAHSSQVFLWGYFQIVSVALINGIVASANFIQQPELAVAVQTYLGPEATKIMGIILVASVAVTLWARSRNKSKNPISFKSPGQ